MPNEGQQFHLNAKELPSPEISPGAKGIQPTQTTINRRRHTEQSEALMYQNDVPVESESKTVGTSFSAEFGGLGSAGPLPGGTSAQSRARVLAQQRELQLKRRQQAMCGNQAMMRSTEGVPSGVTPAMRQFGAQLRTSDIYGSGTGIHTQTLANKGAAATGVDIAEGMLAQARKMYSDPIFIQGSAVDLPFSDSQFSTVFSSMALQWVSDTGLVANEIARVLEKSGIAELAIMVAGSFSELKTARKVAQLPQAETYMPTTAQWVNGFKQSGLSLQRVITKDYVDTHCDIMSLLRSVKGVGAGETGRKQPPLTRRDIKKLAMAYSNMSGVESKLPLTYRVSHFRLEKR